jgi:hypothetical protein
MAIHSYLPKGGSGSKAAVGKEAIINWCGLTENCIVEFPIPME